MIPGSSLEICIASGPFPHFPLQVKYTAQKYRQHDVYTKLQAMVFQSTKAFYRRIRKVVLQERAYHATKPAGPGGEKSDVCTLDRLTYVKMRAKTVEKQNWILYFDG